MPIRRISSTYTVLGGLGTFDRPGAIGGATPPRAVNEAARVESL